MNSVVTEETLETAVRDGGYMLFIRKCDLRNGRFVALGEQIAMPLKDAVAKFCHSADPRARANVFRAKRGSYLGIRSKGNQLVNFLIENPTADGNARWLFRKMPEFEASIVEVYVVDEVNRAKNAADLPTLNPVSYGDHGP